MRVKHGRTRFIDNLPATIQDALGNSEVFEDFELFREFVCLPYNSAHSSICIREVIEAVAFSVARSRVLDQLLVAVNSVKGVLPFERGVGLRELAAVYGTHLRIGEIGN